MASTERGIAAGVALFGLPAAHATADGGATWTPSKEKCKGMAGTLSGQDIHALDGEGNAYAMVVKPVADPES